MNAKLNWGDIARKAEVSIVSMYWVAIVGSV